MVQPPLNVSTPPIPPSPPAAKKNKSLHNTFLVFGILEFINFSIGLFWIIILLRASIISGTGSAGLVNPAAATTEEYLSAILFPLVMLAIIFTGIVGSAKYKLWGYSVITLVAAYIILDLLADLNRW